MRAPHSAFTPPEDTRRYMDNTNEQHLTIVQIETQEAVDRIDEIAAVPGVDALYLGPGDLSVALGIPGQVEDPRVLEVAERIVAACKEHGKIAGSHFVGTSMLEKIRACGMQLGLWCCGTHAAIWCRRDGSARAVGAVLKSK